MRRKVSKDLAIGYLIENPPNLFFRNSWILILFGGLTLIPGIIELKRGNYFVAYIGLSLIVAGIVLFIKFGTSPVLGKLYFYPDKLVIEEKQSLRVIKREEVEALEADIISYEGQQLATILKRGPVSEEGDRNVLKIYLKEDFLLLKFQIKNATMFKKFKKNIALWERSDYPI